MEARKTRFWIVVLTGVMILSGGLPLSDRYSAAQPLPPGTIKGPVPLAEALEANTQEIDRDINQRNQALEEAALAEGRELQDSERVKLARHVVLKPHPDSPVKDVIVIVWELSDGSTGQSLTGPIFQPWVKGPFGLKIEAMNVDEGWYIVRFVPPEEIQAEMEPPATTEPAPAAEGEPLSFLDRVIGLFSPSEAVACGCTCQTAGPWTHSVYRRLNDNVAPLLAQDGVKLTWVRDTCCLSQHVSSDKRCEVFAAWQYLAPCNDVFLTRAISLALVADHSDKYLSPSGTTSLNIRSYITGYNDGSWSPFGSCTNKQGPSAGSINCNAPLLLDAF